MSLTKLDRFSYVICPLLFALVMIISGIFTTNVDPTRPHGVILICAGLLGMSLYCICGLLAKIIDAK
ncbi:MAG: hypothetical protein ABIC18_03555 [Candidatus Omnitrophota bacterium]